MRNNGVKRLPSSTRKWAMVIFLVALLVCMASAGTLRVQVVDASSEPNPPGLRGAVVVVQSYPESKTAARRMSGTDGWVAPMRLAPGFYRVTALMPLDKSYAAMVREISIGAGSTVIRLGLWYHTTDFAPGGFAPVRITVRAREGRPAAGANIWPRPWRGLGVLGATADSAGQADVSLPVGASKLAIGWHGRIWVASLRVRPNRNADAKDKTMQAVAVRLSSCPMGHTGGQPCAASTAEEGRFSRGDPASARDVPAVEIDTCGAGMVVTVVDRAADREVARVLADKYGGVRLPNLRRGHIYYAYISDPDPWPHVVPFVLLIDPERSRPLVHQCEFSMPNYSIRRHPVRMILTDRSGHGLSRATVWAFRYPGGPAWVVDGKTDSQGQVILNLPVDRSFRVGIEYRRHEMFADAKLPAGSDEDSPAGESGASEGKKSETIPEVDLSFDDVN